MSSGIGLPEQTARNDSSDNTAKTRNRGQDGQNGKAWTEQLGQDNWYWSTVARQPRQMYIWKRTTGTGQPGRVIHDRRERTGLPEHDNMDKTVETGRLDKSASQVTLEPLLNEIPPESATFSTIIKNENILIKN
jgi:hypothetical protein